MSRDGMTKTPAATAADRTAMVAPLAALAETLSNEAGRRCRPRVTDVSDDLTHAINHVGRGGKTGETEVEAALAKDRVMAPRSTARIGLLRDAPAGVAGHPVPAILAGAIRIRLDEVIRVTPGTRNPLPGPDDLEGSGLDRFRTGHAAPAPEALARPARGGADMARRRPEADGRAGAASQNGTRRARARGRSGGFGPVSPAGGRCG